MGGEATLPIARGTLAKVRRRRSGEEVRALILRAARAAFAEHGFAGATTRDIAERAGATEALIFRHFGSKAGLFEAAILMPFEELIRSFLAKAGDMPDRHAANDRFVAAFYPFLRANADLLHALARSGALAQQSRPAGLDTYFALAAERLRAQYDREGARAEVDPALAVRLCFGMVASAILLESWFFGDHAPAEPVAVDALSRMLFKALAPMPADDADH